MKSRFAKFIAVSVANLVVGGGLGTIAAWCMTAGLEREYQLAISEGGTALGAVLGLLLGWVGYYGIFRQRVNYETFCAVLSITTMATAITAYVLHILTDTGGWLSIFVAIVVFLVATLKLRTS